MTNTLLLGMLLYRCKPFDYQDLQCPRRAFSKDVHSVVAEKQGRSILLSSAQPSSPLGIRSADPDKIGGWGPDLGIMKNYNSPSTMQWHGSAAA